MATKAKQEEAKLEPATVEPPAPKVKRYFVVNPAGAIHEVTKAHATERLGKIGWKSATAAQVKQLIKQNGKQRHNAPIAKPFAPTPEAIDVEGIELD